MDLIRHAFMKNFEHYFKVKRVLISQTAFFFLSISSKVLLHRKISRRHFQMIFIFLSRLWFGISSKSSRRDDLDEIPNHSIETDQGNLRFNLSSADKITSAAR